VKQSRKRRHVVREMLEAEQRFVSYLKLLQTVWGKKAKFWCFHERASGTHLKSWVAYCRNFWNLWSLWPIVDVFSGRTTSQKCFVNLISTFYRLQRPWSNFYYRK
jgi:hypothetical protein